MMPNNPALIFSALATAAFVAVVAVGLATGPRPEAAALMSVIEGFARETIPLD